MRTTTNVHTDETTRISARVTDRGVAWIGFGETAADVVLFTPGTSNNDEQIQRDLDWCDRVVTAVLAVRAAIAAREELTVDFPGTVQS